MNVRRGETLSMCHGVFEGAMVRARHSFRSTVVRWPNARTEMTVRLTAGACPFFPVSGTKAARFARFEHQERLSHWI